MLNIRTYFLFQELVTERLIHKFSLSQSSRVSPERVWVEGSILKLADLCEKIINILGCLPNLAFS